MSLNKIYKTAVGSIAVAFIAFLLVGCNAINNAIEDALKKENFNLTSLDEKVVDILGDSSIVNGKYISKTAATFDTAGTDYVITLPNNKVVNINKNSTNQIIDTLLAYNVSLAVQDTAIRVTTGTPLQSGFVLHTLAYNSVVIYVTDFVTVEVVKADGSVVSPKSTKIPVELSSSCYSINPTTKKPQPKVRTRVEYELRANNQYLVKFIRGDQTLSKIFYVAVLGE